ncbi:MAG: hypothetical protein ACP5E9_07535 [Candidatus Methanospirareceae archaeon]
MCEIREPNFSRECAGVQPHEVRSYAGTVEELARHAEELSVTVLVARPMMADLVLGAQEQR